MVLALRSRVARSVTGGIRSERRLYTEVREVIDFIGKLFKKAGRGVGGFVKRAAPVLKNVARVAAPIAGVAAAVLVVRRSRRRRVE